MKSRWYVIEVKWGRVTSVRAKSKAEAVRLAIELGDIEGKSQVKSVREER